MARRGFDSRGMFRTSNPALRGDMLRGLGGTFAAPGTTMTVEGAVNKTGLLLLLLLLSAGSTWVLTDPPASFGLMLGAILVGFVIAGASWGGYITLQTIGTVPEGWRAALAIVPVADYVAAFEDEAPALQALDASLFGGTPDDVPDLYRERSPLTYVDRVRSPVLIYAGDNDSRCPLRQILNYVERLTALGRDCELRRYDAGHGAMVVAEQVRHMRWELDFVAGRLPGR